MKYAYLTCELLGRDLDSRLLIASHLVRNGISCIVGQQWSIFANLHLCPKGVVLFKTANEVQGRAAAETKKAGHKVVLSDEEMLAVTGDASVTSPLSVSSADVFLANNSQHKAAIESIGPVRCEVVGNARVELLTRHKGAYAEEVSQIKKAGSYILFNTSFGTINSLWGDADAALKIALRTMQVPESDQARVADDILRFERANMEAVRDLIAWAKQFNHRVVVRPHPAENPDYWRSFGVEVVEKTNPIPWLLGCELMIHTSSTTGLEGALLGTPCLNVKVASYANSFITDTVNYTVTDVDSAKAAAKEWLTERSGHIASQPKPELLTNGAERTAEVIASLCADQPELTTWASLPPQERQVEKFNIRMKEFTARAERVFASAGTTLDKVTQLDRALFLLSGPTVEN